MKKLFKNLSIIDYLNLIFLTIISLIFIYSFNKTPYQFHLLILYSLLFIMIFLSSWIRGTIQKQKLKQFLMIIYPVLFLFMIFESFFMLLSYFNDHKYDWLMVQIDYLIFNVHPTVWIEQFIKPLYTEILYWLYVIYFPMPLIVLGYMYKNKMFIQIEKSIVAFFITYYGAYLSYFIIPVEGPRFYLTEMQTVPLEGLLFAESIRNLINFLEPNKLDAFPSLHTAIVIITMLVARRYNRFLYNLFIPITIGILISLVYLRYHYFIDIVFGAIWAIISWMLADIIYDKYRKRLAPHFGDQS